MNQRISPYVKRRYLNCLPLYQLLVVAVHLHIAISNKQVIEQGFWINADPCLARKSCGFHQLVALALPSAFYFLLLAALLLHAVASFYAVFQRRVKATRGSLLTLPLVALFTMFISLPLFRTTCKCDNYFQNPEDPHSAWALPTFHELPPRCRALLCFLGSPAAQEELWHIENAIRKERPGVCVYERLHMHRTDTVHALQCNYFAKTVEVEKPSEDTAYQGCCCQDAPLGHDEEPHDQCHSWSDAPMFSGARWCYVNAKTCPAVFEAAQRHHHHSLVHDSTEEKYSHESEILPSAEPCYPRHIDKAMLHCEVVSNLSIAITTAFLLFIVPHAGLLRLFLKNRCQSTFEVQEQFNVSVDDNSSEDEWDPSSWTFRTARTRTMRSNRSVTSEPPAVEARTDGQRGSTVEMAMASPPPTVERR